MLDGVEDSVYTMGYRPEYIRAQARFAQQPSLNFLVPQLAPGQRLLDVGCGGGFLSSQLAEAVAQGELVGIDLEPSQVDLARETAARRGVANTQFQVGDALDLPFRDGSFDVLHFGGVLLHICDVDRALEEARRVLRPGGLIACRDLIPESCFGHPELGMMQRTIEMFVDVVGADGGSPSIARDIKGRLIRAGFADVVMTLSYEIYDTPEEREFFHAVVEHILLEPEGIVNAAEAYGAITEQMNLSIRRCLEEWRHDPGALAAMAFSQATAVRP